MRGMRRNKGRFEKRGEAAGGREKYRGIGHGSGRVGGINDKLRRIILTILVPLILCIIVLLAILGFYAKKYQQLTQNVCVGSEFNIRFKEEIDLNMYYYAVGSRYQEELPIGEVESAITLAEALEQTTYREESRQAIRNVIDYCENLEEKMYALGETPDYDGRIRQLNNNIYVLTALIQNRMMDYVYYEAGYMATVEGEMLRNIHIVILLAGVAVGLVTIFLFSRIIVFSREITEPIQGLCENVRKVGHGEFEIPQIAASDYEIQELNDGVQKMAKRIAALLVNVREEEKLQHKTQLQLLQSQINPHFLYNTLDTIVWLVESEMNDEAVKMLGSLSLFFRTSLSKGADVVCMSEEIEHTRSYMEIQQTRYRDIMDYSIKVPEELSQVMLPKLTLQPLVENAIYHGAKEKRGKSSIAIRAERESGGDIVLTVEDNGIGMKPERLAQIRKSLDGEEREGFGLAAVNDRIRLYFGEGYGLTVESEYGRGTKITVRLSENIEPL